MKNKPTDSQAEELKALRKEVLSLQRQLRDEQMRADIYETMVDMAEEPFNIEIRKKAGHRTVERLHGEKGYPVKSFVHWPV